MFLLQNKYGRITIYISHHKNESKKCIIIFHNSILLKANHKTYTQSSFLNALYFFIIIKASEFHRLKRHPPKVPLEIETLHKVS